MTVGGRRILFLDFDGVLHATSEYQTKAFSRVHHLEVALSKGVLRVVISSSWRFHHSMEELRAFLPPALGRLVEGVTGPPHFGEHARFHEIDAYMQTNGGACDWRALDDSAFEFPRGCNQLILCDPNEGMGETQVRQIRDWLDRP